jgi:hypothetical protein
MASYGPSNAFVPGRFNVWLPNAASNAYLSFDTAAEAQAAQTSRSSGVILDPAGKVDARLQAWSGWTTFQAQIPRVAAPVVLTTPGGTAGATTRPGAPPVIATVPATPAPSASPVGGQYNVYVPAGFFSSAGLTPSPATPSAGAFLAFSTAADAQAFATAKGVGVLVEPDGNLSAAQPWSMWGSYGVQIEAFRVADKPAAGKFHLWVPPMYVGSMGLPNAAPFLTTGAYLSFDTAADAQASVARRGLGVVLTPSGGLNPIQPWPQFTFAYAQIPGMAAQFQATRTPGKPSLWVPAGAVGQIGITQPDQFPHGTFVTFNTAAEAQALATTLHTGFVLDPAGALEATQPNPNAANFAPQLLNPGLTATPTAGKVNVWFPIGMLNALGTNDVQKFTQGNGAYLAFSSEAEAQAHVTARTFGVVLDAAGAVSATQPWPQATQFAAQLLNDKLTPQRTAGQFGVWFPTQQLWNIGLKDPSRFPNGAFLAFPTAADAQAHAKARGEGVVLDASGNLDATQSWGLAARFGAQLLNPQLAAAPIAGQFNVWFPTQYVGNLGTDAMPFQSKGAYLAFKSEADAQAHINARTFGILLDGTGKPSASQPWSYAPQFIAQLDHPRLATAPTAGQYNVWFPGQYAYQLGVASPAQFQKGAYLSFATEAEAQAHAKSRGIGVVLGPSGTAEPTQPWQLAPQFLAQRLNSQMTSSRTDGQYSVWVPQQYLTTTGVTDVTPFNDGAYLSFATQGEAQQHAKDRGLGVVLDTKGELDATQPWSSAAMFGAQRLNSKLTAAATPGRYNVWFPQSMLGNVGLRDVTPYKNGAYLAFATAAEAQAHAKARGIGIIFDAAGNADATQTWGQAGLYLAQRLNDKLTAQRTDGKYSVWFPASLMWNIGVTNGAAFPQGAYLAFDSKAEALAHLKQRGNIGVMVNERGVADTTQLWPQALDQVAGNPALQLPPPSGWVEGPVAADAATATRLGDPTAGSVAIGAVTPTRTGADVTAYVATVRPPDMFRFFVGAQINGNWMPIYSVPDLVRLSANGWQQFTLHLDYAAIDTYLKGVNPALGVTPDMSGAIGIRFTSGHDTGIPGWSQNQGTEKDALTKLPAKVP